MRLRSIIALLALASLLPLAGAQASLPDGLYAKIATAKGAITLRLEHEKAPLTVTSFVGLAEGSLDASKGKRYFDGLIFHRVVADFVIQGGDPQGNGQGGPGYAFPNEISDLKHDSAGVLAMANAGPDTNGSQFYITLAATPFLDGNYTVFGKVVEGLDAVRKVVQGDRMDKVEIIRVGKAAKDFKADQASFNDRRAKLVAAASKKAEAAREVAVAQIKKQWPDLARGPDGIFYKTTKAGAGAVAAAGATVSVNYKGSFLDGKVFDESKPQAPISIQAGAGQVIPGWDKVLVTMKKGEKRFVVIPPELAYGTAGYPGVIPGNSWLVFEMELVDIK